MGQSDPHHVVIVSGGFGGLYAAKVLRRAPVRVTLVDQRNFHLFQPLLHQVAAGGLSTGDIAHPLRAVFADDPHTSVLMGEVVDIDVARRALVLRGGELTYDTVIIATGAATRYFGPDDWANKAPGLKTIEDALEMRRRILMAFGGVRAGPGTAAGPPDVRHRRRRPDRGGARRYAGLAGAWHTEGALPAHRPG